MSVKTTGGTRLVRAVGPRGKDAPSLTGAYLRRDTAQPAPSDVEREYALGNIGTDAVYNRKGGVAEYDSIAYDDFARTGLAGRGWKQEIRSDLGLSYPIVCFRPTNLNTQIAVDIMPRGNPDVGSAFKAWLDIVAQDLLANSSPSTLYYGRLGVTGDGIVVLGAVGSPNIPAVQVRRGGSVQAHFAEAGGIPYVGFGRTDYTLNATSGLTISTTGTAYWQAPAAPCAYLNRTGSQGAIFDFRFVGDNVGSVAVTNTGTAFNTTSDGRLKPEDYRVPLEEEPGALDKLLAVDVVAFDWYSMSGQALGKRDYGVIAQDVHAILPNAVTVGLGEPGAPNFQPWSVDYSKFVPLLIAHVQRLERRVAELEASAGGA